MTLARAGRKEARQSGSVCRGARLDWIDWKRHCECPWDEEGVGRILDNSNHARLPCLWISLERRAWQQAGGSRRLSVQVWHLLRCCACACALAPTVRPREADGHPGPI